MNTFSVHPEDRRPAVSVVVPTRSRPERLGPCLRSLREQELPGERYEVVVIDDGGVPTAAESLSKEDLGDVCRVHWQPRAGPAAARNSGARLAAGQTVAFLDDDCVAEPGWLAALLTALGSRPEALVGGRTLNGLPERLYSSASHHLVQSLVTGREPSGEVWFVPSSNIALSADAFREMGGFSEHFPMGAGADRDFCRRWRAAGRPIVLAPEAVVRHAHELDLGAFLRQYRNHGRGAYLARRASGRRGERWTPEPQSFYRPVSRPPQDSRIGRAGWVSAIALSQAASAVGYAEQALRSIAPRGAATD